MKEHILDLKFVMNAASSNNNRSLLLNTPSSSGSPTSVTASPSSDSVASSSSAVIRMVMYKISFQNYFTRFLIYHVIIFQVPVHSRVMITEGQMRKVKIALRTDGNSKKSLNSGASILMDALFTNEQLANMSISGNKCPSIPDAKPKPAIDKDILNEMISMMRLDPFYFMLTT